MVLPARLVLLATAFALLAVLAGCPAPDPLELLDTALPEATAGHTYSAQLESRGGATPHTRAACQRARLPAAHPRRDRPAARGDRLLGRAPGRHADRRR